MGGEKTQELFLCVESMPPVASASDIHWLTGQSSAKVAVAAVKNLTKTLLERSGDVR